jgi:cytochrome P450
MERASDTRQQVTGYRAVREAARDWETYSSDLLGERQIRSYRHLPLESDPPRHTLFRQALQPLFMTGAIEPHQNRFEALAATLIADLNASQGGEVVAEVALPYVVGCLAIIFNREQDYEEWLSWGADVFDVDHHSSTKTVDDYLHRVLAEAAANPVDDVEKMDIWDRVAALAIGGVGLSDEEKQGIASLLLAGGRDTTIKLVTGLVWHLIASPADREHLQSNPDARNLAVSELVRYLTPLQGIERVVTDANWPDAPLPSDYVVLDFLSANMDRTIWPNPDEVDIYRARIPNLAFGFGRHSCLGMNVAQIEAKSFLNAILTAWPNWQFDGEPRIDWQHMGDSGETRYLDRFISVSVATNPTNNEA